MMQKSTTFTTILRVKKCHFHYDMQKTTFSHNKYSSIISSNYIFKGFAFETLGPFERIFLAIQRGNAASIRGTFPDSALSEIFAL
jgi:hypothetical protein